MKYEKIPCITQELSTDPQCWPCTSTSPRRCRPHGTGRCSGLVGDCSQTPGCAIPPPPVCWPRSSATPLPPPGRSPSPHWTRPVWCRLALDGEAASGRHRTHGADQRWTAPGMRIRVKRRSKRQLCATHNTGIRLWYRSTFWYLLISDVVVAVFCGAGCFPGVTPVQELLFEQGGFIVLSQSAEHCPVRTTLAFPAGEAGTVTQLQYLNPWKCSCCTVLVSVVICSIPLQRTNIKRDQSWLKH